MKIRASDCLYILRKFQVAGDEHVPRDISRLTVMNPSPTNTLAEFRFDSAIYVLLFDDSADDDEAYIHQQVALSLPGRDVGLLHNPQSGVTTYALPYEGKSVYVLKVDADRQRLDIYLAETQKELSRSSWQKHIRAGRVSVDGEVQLSPKYAVASSSLIDISLPDVPTHDGRQLPIIYIDDDVIVVDKPVGVLTHTKNQLDHEFTVADYFRRYTTQGLDTDRPGVVHRLDRDTSGLIVGARHLAAYTHLKHQFATRLVDKTYYAVVEGEPSQASIHIDLPIARSINQPGKFIVKRGGKAAQTSLELVRSENRRSLLRLRPTTGRTHQLRVHLASLGLPIVGDRLYGAPARRLYLHAAGLELTLPSGARREFTAPIPNEFDELLEASK